MLTSNAPRSTLQVMTEQYPNTSLWNDSADPDELSQSIAFGAVGATCNPVIALAVMKDHSEVWAPRIQEIAREKPTATESEIAWFAIEELSMQSAQMLLPAFEASKGINGRLSIQTDPRYYTDADALLKQALHFNTLAENLIIKIPAVPAGIIAIEEATYHGVSINATVSFTVAQAIAVAEAVERGLERRDREGLSSDHMGPVCTIMGGRLDDWIKICAAKDGVLLPPGYLEWPGVIAVKTAYRIYKERGYRTRMLSAAFRNELLLTEMVGGDLVISPPFKWQKLINDNYDDLPVRMDAAVDPDISSALSARIPDYRCAVEPEGLSVEEFVSYGATTRTLRQFLASTAELELFVRDILLPSA